MSGSKGSNTGRRVGSAIALLWAQPRRFGFDAAVRVMLRAAVNPDPAEVARFRSAPGMAYPPADITQLREGTRPAVTTAAMTLVGSGGVLPRMYTEVLAATLRDRSRALHDFIDLLSHRMVAAFARARTKYRPHLAAEAATLASPAAPDPVAAALLALSGFGTPFMADRLAAGVDPLLHYSGLLAMRPRSADRLAAIASDWLGRKVEVVQFAGAWLFLPADQRTRMPAGRRAGAFNRLGMDAAIGVRAWDIQARVILVVGPLDRAAFEALLPDRPALKRFVSLMRAYLGFETGFAVNPVLAATAVPVLRLDPASNPAPRLGWNTWLPSAGPRARDAGEAIFEAETVEAEAEHRSIAA